MALQLWRHWVAKQSLVNDSSEENRTIEVSSPQTAGLVRQTVEPFESCAAHPRWRPRDCARVEVKSCADPYEGRSSEVANVRVHPFLLLPGAEANPDKVGLGRVDAMHNGCILLGREVTEGWAKETADLQVRKSFSKPPCESGGYAFSASVEEVAQPVHPA